MNKENRLVVTRGEGGWEWEKGVQVHMRTVMDKNQTTGGEHEEVYSGIDK